MGGNNLTSSQKSAAAAGLSSSPGASDNTQTCPFAQQTSTQPCDAVSLMLKEGDRSVSCTEPWERDGSLTAAHLEKLNADDLLLQTIAGYHKAGHYDAGAGDEALKPAMIVPVPETAPACPIGEHPSIEWQQVGVYGENATQTIRSSKTLSLLAASTRAGSGGWFLEPFWSSSESRRTVHRFTLNSCGVRDGAVPNGNLHGRVEVYPNDEFELTIKIPPFRKYKKSVEKDVRTGTKVSSESSEQNTPFGVKSSSSTSTTTNLGKGTAYTTTASSNTDRAGNTEARSQSEGLKDGDDYYAESGSSSERGFATTYTYSESDATDQDAPKSGDSVTMSLAGSESISLKRNGTEVDITKTINKVISIARDVKSAFDDIKESVPKIGWQADLDCGVLEGSITGSWGIKPDATKTHDRIWTVDDYFTISFDVNIFFVKATIGFGIEFKIENWFSSHPFLEIVLKVEVGLELKAPFKQTFSNHNAENLTTSLAFEAAPICEAVARASAAGYTLGASAKLTSGLEFKGEFKIGVEQSPELKGELGMKTIVLVGVVSYPGDDPWREELFRHPTTGKFKPWYEGSIPSKDDASDPKAGGPR